MGSCNSSSKVINMKKSIYLHPIDISYSDFQFIRVIGQGGFGQVWDAQKRITKQRFAIKELSKVRIVLRNSVHSVTNEVALLANLRHPFLVNIYYAFQTVENLYLCLDLLSGGDLRYHLNKRDTFTEDETRILKSLF